MKFFIFLSVIANICLLDAKRYCNKIKCPKLAASAQVPNSVHRLRPGDIKVVAAMGDSLTAGRGAKLGALGLLVDFRGSSWSIGGDTGKSYGKTFPNILRHYNPNIYGFSTGNGKRELENSHLNVARSGAKSYEMLEQAKMLVKRMREDINVDLEHDWKVVTLFIGGNDLCDFCKNETRYSPANYKAHIRDALDYLQANSPRTLVNLIVIPKIEHAKQNAKGVFCEAAYLIVCECVYKPKGDAAWQRVVNARQGFQDAVKDLAGSGRYDVREDFTVVSQSFYENTDAPLLSSGKIDYSYFAADCFHYSSKGQEQVGEALWNNMIQPVGAKANIWKVGTPIACPTEENPYIYTSKNSH